MANNLLGKLDRNFYFSSVPSHISGCSSFTLICAEQKVLKGQCHWQQFLLMDKWMKEVSGLC